MTEFARSIWRWLRGWFGPSSVRFTAIHVEELPEELEATAVYIAGEGQHLWFASMLCPCGCGETLYMNLQKDSRPRWSVSHHSDKSVSLSPSVWRKVGCRSHFYLHKGQIIWCRDGEARLLDRFGARRADLG